VIDIDFNKAITCWAGHAGCEPDDIVRRFVRTETYRHHEIGKISDAAYFQSLRTSLGIDLSDAQFLEGWNAIFAAAFIPTFMLFGILCQRLPLRTLLWWGTVLAVPQMVPLLFIHSMTGALIAAIPIGLMGGIATAAYMDLIIRSCPRGLQGTTLMMSSGLYFIASRFGDVLGTKLYDDYGGFSVCVIAITVVYALILPTILLVPKRLIATADGQTPI